MTLSLPLTVHRLIPTNISCLKIELGPVVNRNAVACIHKRNGELREVMIFKRGMRGGNDNYI